MDINFNKIIFLSNDINITENDKKYIYDHIKEKENKLIYNKGQFLKLNREMFEFNKEINFENYDFSERFLNIKNIISLLEIFNLTSSNTYEIHNFFHKNRTRYNIWKYLNNSEYVNCNLSEYNTLVFSRICISYSWNECLYSILKECLNKNRTYKLFIWIDIFCVNQFNEKIKKKGLDKIDDVYHIADFYVISSSKAFERYWCCYEMSLKKNSIDIILLDTKELSKSKINMSILEKLFNNIFDNNIILFNKDNIRIYKYISEFQKIKEFEKNKFSLKNAKISYDSDKKIIEDKIIKKYSTIEEYEKRINIYIYLITYRDNVSYGYLANKIMNLPLNNNESN